MNEQKSGRRIVSRGEYAGQVSKKIIYLIVGCLGTILAGLCCVFILVLGLCGATIQGYIEFLIGCFVMGLLIGGSIVISSRAFKSARSIIIDIPLTRTNNADLPAIDSLVRASQEPIEQQQTVLLRAANPNDMTPAEQLLRPSVENGE